MKNNIPPFFLAPMEGVSDLPFRILARECGADFTISEFTSSTALNRGSVKSWTKVSSHSLENPFIPQIFGGDIDEMVKATELLCSNESVDIIDINFGCPAPKVCRNDAGAALLGKPDKLVKMVEACIEVSNVPISAKLRLGTGVGEDTALEVSKRLEEIGIIRLCVHGRTLKQGYRGEADWSKISKIVDAVSIPVIANGDVIDEKSALACLNETGAAGLMIGRGAIGNPQVFHQIKQELGLINSKAPWISDEEIWINADKIQQDFIARSWCWNRYVELTKLTNSENKNSLKRHGISFTKHLPGGSKFRGSLQEVKDIADLAKNVSSWLESGANRTRM
ncbi:MAG TPA: tRNA-dihydrouridine synthase family protein [Candidatus Poseidoniaceae archaeon]|nr:tRNA-dihydrouridine synthase family protein [Candidatus Poseidoniaceae archaeon]